MILSYTLLHMIAELNQSCLFYIIISIESVDSIILPVIVNRAALYLLQQLWYLLVNECNFYHQNYEKDHCAAAISNALVTPKEVTYPASKA